MKNIDKTEREWLIQQKLKEGKGITEASEEIKRDIEHINNLNEMKKRLTKEIKQIERNKKQLNKEFKKQFKKLTDQKEEPEKITRKARGMIANTKHLNRIMRHLQEFPNSIVTNISKAQMMTTYMTNDGLKFLIKLNKVERILIGDTKTYKLK